MADAQNSEKLTNVDPLHLAKHGNWYSRKRL